MVFVVEIVMIWLGNLGKYIGDVYVYVSLVVKGINVCF